MSELGDYAYWLADEASSLADDLDAANSVEDWDHLNAWAYELAELFTRFARDVEKKYESIERAEQAET